MAKKHLYLKGKVQWVKHLKPDDKYGDPKWSLKLYPDTESLEIIKKELLEPKENLKPVRNELKLDDEGYNMNFSRRQTQKINGALVAFPAPVVVNADGSPFQGKAIGNGSDCTVKIDVYTHKVPGMPGVRARAARWEGLRIDNLVDFNPARDLTPEQYKDVEEMLAVPKPIF